MSKPLLSTYAYLNEAFVPLLTIYWLLNIGM